MKAISYSRRLAPAMRGSVKVEKRLNGNSGFAALRE
jgi:hypothetical protein